MDNFGEYEIEGYFGEGGYGTVYEVKAMSNEKTYALKVYNSALKAEQNLERMKKQAEYMMRFNSLSEYFLRHIDSIENQKLLYEPYNKFPGYGKQFPGIVMELLRGGDLYSLLQKLPHIITEEIAIFITKIILEALKAIHAKGYSHLDIKLCNILLDQSGKVKIADFGTATATEYLEEMIGTPEYAPPEMRQQDFKCNPQKVDIYHAGLCLLSLLVRATYTILKPHLKIYPIHTNHKLWQYAEEKNNEKYSHEVKRLLDDMLHPDPKLRKSAKELLNNPLFSNLNTNQMIERFKSIMIQWIPIYQGQMEGLTPTRGGHQDKQQQKQRLEYIRDELQQQPLKTTKNRYQLSLSNKPEEILYIVQKKYESKDVFIIHRNEIRNVERDHSSIEITVQFDAFGEQSKMIYFVNLYEHQEKPWVKVEVINQDRNIDEECKQIARTIGKALGARQ